MSKTPNLELNEFGSSGVPSGADLTASMRRLDAVVQLAAISFATEPPATPILGDRHIVESPATGLFAGHELHVAAYSQHGWIFLIPHHGWQAVVGADSFFVFNEQVPEWTAIDADFYSPLTTKGDLLVHNGTSLQRLPVDADGTILQADSAEALGVKWVAASSVGGGVITADSHPSTPTAMDDEFEFGSAIDTTGARRSGASGWTRTVYGTSPIPTDSVQQGSLRILVPVSHTVPTVYRQPIPGSLSSYVIQAKISQQGIISNFKQGGIHLYHSATTRWKTIQLIYTSGLKLERSNWTASTFGTASSSDVFGDPSIYRGWIYFQAAYESSPTPQVIFSYSLTGLLGSFTAFHTENLSTFFGAGNVPDYAGIHVNDSSFNLYCDWFRRVA